MSDTGGGWMHPVQPQALSRVTWLSPCEPLNEYGQLCGSACLAEPNVLVKGTKKTADCTVEYLNRLLPCCIAHAWLVKEGDHSQEHSWRENGVPLCVGNRTNVLWPRQALIVTCTKAVAARGHNRLITKQNDTACHQALCWGSDAKQRYCCVQR